MKWLIGCLLYSVLFINQIPYSLVGAADSKVATGLNINLIEIQDYANQYHELIEQTLYVYRSEFNRILREDGINNSLSYLNHEAGLALDTKDNFILELWLSKSNDCFDLLSPKIDSAFEETGYQFSKCSTDYDDNISIVSSKILIDIQWQQGSSLEMQRITTTELRRSNVLTQPDETKDNLRATLEAFDTYWRETVEPNVLTNLMTFRIQLQDATRQFNYCLQDYQVAFRNQVSELKTELNACVEAAD